MLRSCLRILCLALAAVSLQPLQALPQRRELKDASGSNSASVTFPTFTTPDLGDAVPNPPVTGKSDSGNLVFSDTLPASAVNLGLGANAFPGETNQQNDLLATVASNITLFLQETFGGNCPLPGSYCQDVQNAFWSMLVNDLMASSQANADPTLMNKTISVLNDIFYIFQPKGLTAPTPDLVTKILDAVPSPTPDPTSVIVTKIGSIVSDMDGALQKVTGFSPPPGGLSAVLEHFFGSTPTIDGAAAAAAGAAGGR